MRPIDFVVYLFPAVTVAALFYFFAYYWRVQRAPLAVCLTEERPPRPPFSFAGKLHPMTRRDVLPLVLITAIYAFTAFANLGSLSSPQSVLDLGGNETHTVALPQPVLVSKLWYHTNLGTGSCQVEISSDGENWLSLWQRKDDPSDADAVTGYYWADGTGYSPSYAMTQKYNQLYKWLEIELDNPQYVSFLRITGDADKGLLELGELALFDETGSLVDLSGVDDPLFDEQDTIPEAISWYNSTYFDEIYHPRTAQEHIQNVYPYEISHPPLGKLIISLGIRMFGMCPFGWRFMGTAFGVAMLPLLYLFLKNLFGRTVVAACGTILFAADFMHLTQTRIGTIDTYGVFFILLMYYFMYRYLALPAGASFRRCALPLFLSGLFWGIGAASKWTVIYGCAGLVVLYFIGLYQKLRDYPAERRQERGGWCLKILAFSVLCFVLIPAVIYVLSYIPYAQAKGDTSVGGLLKIMWDNQVYMFTYHKGVTDSHPYSSRWYQWIFDIRPILYYLDNTSVPGYKTAFGAFSNPVVCWGGLLAVIAVGIQAVRRHSARALFIFIGYLSQLLPWLLIGRITFAYHYFPSILFLVMALAWVFNDLARREVQTNWRPAVYGVTGGAVALYALFYPVLVGISIPLWYSSHLLRWFPSWPF